MSVERWWEWTCDACGRVERRRAAGFPAGWIYVRAPQSEVEHRCPECAKDVPPAQRGFPQEVARE